MKYPLNRFSLTDYITVPDSGIVQRSINNDYDLYGVVNHHSFTGSGGHYTAFVRSNDSQNMWMKCNDSTLNYCTEKEVITNDAYLLFYKRAVMTSSNIINLAY